VANGTEAPARGPERTAKDGGGAEMPAVGPAAPDVATGSAASGQRDGAALPPGGRPGAIPPEYEGYVRAFRQRIQERLRYPWLAVRQGLQGTVELEVRLDAGGRLTDVAAVGREATGPLRDAAIQAVRDATPFPLPVGLEARALTIQLPVVFQLR
jgi:protein TonB